MITSLKNKIAVVLFIFTYINNAVYAQSADSIITPEKLNYALGVLASDSFQGRGNFTSGLLLAADFIAKRFDSIGLQHYNNQPSFYQPFLTLKAEIKLQETQTDTLYNIIGVLPGKSKPNEIVIFSAHYDHIGVQHGSKTDSIYNGANDDASGTAAVLLLAEYFAKTRQNERTLLFCCFSGEELGLFGSTHFVKNINPDQIIAVVNIEMIGRYKQFGKGRAMVTGWRLSNFKDIINQPFKKTPLPFLSDRFYTANKLFYRSDNYPFAQQGIPAHTIMSSSDRDRHYHAYTDELKTLDIGHATKMVQLIATATQTLVNGTQAPTRLKKE